MNCYGFLISRITPLVLQLHADCFSFPTSSISFRALELSNEFLIAKIGVDTAENDQERVPERPNKTQTERLRTLLRLSSPRTGSSR